ncbi:unnamed protein product, partial [Cyprideis torosa]
MKMRGMGLEERYERAASQMLDRWHIMIRDSHLPQPLSKFKMPPCFPLSPPLQGRNASHNSPASRGGQSSPLLLSLTPSSPRTGENAPFNLTAFEERVLEQLQSLCAQEVPRKDISDNVRILRETVKTLIMRIGEAYSERKSDFEGGRVREGDSISQKCGILNQKLDALLRALNEEGFSDDEEEDDKLRTPSRLLSRLNRLSRILQSGLSTDQADEDDPLFSVQRKKRLKTQRSLKNDLVHARANSLKKAVRSIIEHTQAAIEEHYSRKVGHHFPETSISKVSVTPGVQSLSSSTWKKDQPGKPSDSPTAIPGDHMDFQSVLSLETDSQSVLQRKLEFYMPANFAHSLRRSAEFLYDSSQEPPHIIEVKCIRRRKSSAVSFCEREQKHILPGAVLLDRGEGGAREGSSFLLPAHSTPALPPPSPSTRHQPVDVDSEVSLPEIVLQQPSPDSEDEQDTTSPKPPSPRYLSPPEFSLSPVPPGKRTSPASLATPRRSSAYAAGLEDSDASSSGAEGLCDDEKQAKHLAANFAHSLRRSAEFLYDSSQEPPHIIEVKCIRRRKSSAVSFCEREQKHILPGAVLLDRGEGGSREGSSFLLPAHSTPALPPPSPSTRHQPVDVDSEVSLPEIVLQQPSPDSEDEQRAVGPGSPLAMSCGLVVPSLSVVDCDDEDEQTVDDKEALIPRTSADAAEKK